MNNEPHPHGQHQSIWHPERRKHYQKVVNPMHWLRNRCFPLFVALVLLLFIYPQFAKGDDDTSLIGASLFALLPAIGVISLSGKRGIVVTLIALVVCLILAFSMEKDLRHALVGWPGLVVIGYYLFSTVLVAHAVFKKDAIQDDRIYGGVSVYMLIGIFFSIIHHRINELNPGAYQTSVTSIPALQQFNWDDFLYFSFTTLTTMGYGDIVPVAARARSTALVEAVIGVLYPAVLIARLVNWPSSGAAKT
ncbi:MAG: hypothetical protein K8R92_05130 [Planctomycetes bacterium]|nr:hypothetical protein [Planctomycetota bacterium]